MRNKGGNSPLCLLPKISQKPTKGFTKEWTASIWVMKPILPSVVIVVRCLMIIAMTRTVSSSSSFYGYHGCCGCCWLSLLYDYLHKIKKWPSKWDYTNLNWQVWTGAIQKMDKFIIKRSKICKNYLFFNFKNNNQKHNPPFGQSGK